MPPFPADLQFYAVVATALLLGALAGIVPLFIACYSFLQKFATKLELAALQKRHDDQAKATADEIDKIEATLLAGQVALETRLSSNIAESRTANTGQNAAISAKIDGLTTTMQLFVNETSKQTGVIEGKMQLMEKLADAKLHQPPPRA